MGDEILRYYESWQEESRLTSGLNQLELVRTREVLTRFLPSPPASVLDVGGGTGIHAEWLARQGYRVHLVDLVPSHVERVREALAAEGVTAEVGDARDLSATDDSVDAALLLGPLYHLPEREDRVRALREASRVVRPGGLVAVAVISRFASLFSGLESEYLFDDDFFRVLRADLINGVHENPTEHPEWFTTAYFHHPDEVQAEFMDAGLGWDELFGLEGMALWLPHLAGRWDNAEGQERLLESARLVETEPTLRGLSAHLLAIGHVPA